VGQECGVGWVNEVDVTWLVAEDGCGMDFACGLGWGGG
jgi:hypothetical protein